MKVVLNHISELFISELIIIFLETSSSNGHTNGAKDAFYVLKHSLQVVNYLYDHVYYSKIF